MERPKIDLSPKPLPRNCPEETIQPFSSKRSNKKINKRIIDVKKSGTAFNEMKRIIKQERRKKEDELLQYNYQNDDNLQGICLLTSKLFYGTFFSQFTVSKYYFTQ